jgi:predicted aconitase with swiveling domain
MEIAADCVLPGTGEGRLLSTRQAISFWGCVDPATGKISDKRHELFGRSISKKILMFPFGKGSSTGSLILLELLRLNLAPAAIINIRTEPLLATGPIVGKHFYEMSFPIVNINSADFDLLMNATYAEVVSLPDASYIRNTRPKPNIKYLVDS